MMRSSIIAIGSTALWIASSAIAAELPSREATPPARAAETCEIDGKPGYRLPGSDVCLKLGGYVSGQISAGSLAK